VSDVIQAQHLQAQNFNFQFNKQAPIQQTKNLPKQNIIFDEVGKLASNLKYIHVAIPLNITTFYEQGLILENYLKNLANTTTSEIRRIPFTKAARDTGVWGLRRLSKIMKQIVNLDQILPHNDTVQDRLNKDNAHKRLKRDIACLYGYSSKPKECNVIGDVAEFFLNPIAAIIKASKGPKYADSKQAQDIKDAALQVQISWYEREIEKIHRRLYTIPKDLPQSYLDGLSTIRPPPTTTTHPTHNPRTHWKNSYLQIKLAKFRKTIQLT